MDRAPVRYWALLQEDEETRETYYLSVLSGQNGENDWCHEWVDDLDGALLLEWSQMVALACSLKTGRGCEVVPVQDEVDNLPVGRFRSIRSIPYPNPRGW